MATTLKDLVSIRDAARAVGKRFYTIRALVDDGRVEAVEDGGSPKHPRLKVRVSEVEAALLRRVYQPPSQRKRRESPKKLNPLVRC